MASDESPSLASGALRRGEVALGRSFRFHRPRGALCGRGYCAQCEVPTVDGWELACEAPPGARPSRRVPLRPLGRIAERWPPWFYERRFLRPAAARGRYLHLLRHLTAAPTLGAARAIHHRPFLEEELELARVGSGGNVGGLAFGIYEGQVLGVLRPDALVAIRFERLVLATGSYERLPPVRGNDLPGILGLAALERYAAASGLGSDTRVAVWGPSDRRARARAAVERAGARLVWEDGAAPTSLLGRGRLRGLDAGGRVPCDLFVVAAAQPALELAFQAGARAELTTDGLPVLVAAEGPEWLEVEGEAGARSSGVPDVAADDDAFACLCEDVRVRDVRRAIEEGFDHPELVKRRTGALTGPCQGKLCAPAVLALLREAGKRHEPTTPRPLARSLALADLAADA